MTGTISLRTCYKKVEPIRLLLIHGEEVPEQLADYVYRFPVFEQYANTRHGIFSLHYLLFGYNPTYSKPQSHKVGLRKPTRKGASVRHVAAYTARLTALLCFRRNMVKHNGG